MSTHSVMFRESVQAQSAPTAEDRAPVHAGARMLLHLVLAALPLLAISAQVFGFLAMRTAAALIILPLVLAIALFSLFAPHPSDRIALAGFLWGVGACVLYDVFRLDTVYLLGLWGDFIPAMGSWVTGNPPGGWDGAVVGYVWRYIGDGGGIGVAFFILAVAAGLGRYGRRVAVLAGVGFAVFPVWAGLIATVALAPRGQELMFPLTATTVTLSLVGHLIFGVVLGLGFWHARGVQDHWPWPPLVTTARTAPGSSAPSAGPATPASEPASSVAGRRNDPAGHGLSRAVYEEWQREVVRRRSSLRRVRTTAYGFSPNPAPPEMAGSGTGRPGPTG